MKTNSPLQISLNCFHPSQLAWYSAHVLKSALLNSPAVLVRAAVPAVLPKAAILYQSAKPARAATAAVTAVNNTTGYSFGELYLNSPPYPVGTAIPAIAAKPSSLEVVAQPAVLAVPGITAINAPPVIALKGWEDAIKITRTSQLCTIEAELPVAANVGIVGSNKVVIGEITPSALQATAWLDELGSQPLNGTSLNDPSIPTLEQYFWHYAQLCDHTTVDTIRVVNGVSLPCKKITVNVYALTGFDPLLPSIQLSEIRDAAHVGS